MIDRPFEIGFERHQDLIVVRCYGFWGADTRNRFEQQLRESIYRLDGKGFDILYDIREQEAQSQTVVEAQSRLSRAVYDLGARNVAIVLTNSLLRMQIKRAHGRTPSLFDDERKAREWLAEQRPR